jgi:SAM-dependent methyltransferase
MNDMINSGISADLMGMDLSLKMINMAKDKVKKNPAVQLMNADAFNMPLRSNHKFDLIHIDSVLHHLIGKTRSDSLRLSDQMLHQLTNRLTENGILIVEEWAYVSYLVPQFTSTIIFYGLKLLNLLHLDVSNIVKEIKLGLEVNFLHGKELESLLKNNGATIVMEKRMPREQGIPLLYRCFLLKNVEYVSYMAKAHSTSTK